MIIVFGTANIGLISSFAREAGVSPSAVVSLTILASFTSACAFFFLYGEVLNNKHWMGMFAIMISVIIIGFSRGQKSSTVEVQEKGFLEHMVKVAIPVSLAMINVLLYTGAAVFTRQVLVMGYPRLRFAIEFSGLAGVFYTIGLIYC